MTTSKTLVVTVLVLSYLLSYVRVTQTDGGK